MSSIPALVYIYMAVTETSLLGYHKQSAGTLHVMRISDILSLNIWRCTILFTLDLRFCTVVWWLKPLLFVAMAGNDSAICIDLKTLLLILFGSCYI